MPIFIVRHGFSSNQHERLAKKILPYGQIDGMIETIRNRRFRL